MFVDEEITKEGRIKSLIMKYSLNGWMNFLRNYFEDADRKKIPNVQDHMIAYVIAVLSERLILELNPDVCASANELNNLAQDFDEILQLMLSEFIHDPYVDKGNNNDFNDTIRFLARKSQSQLIVIDRNFTQFHRLLFLFKELPLHSEMSEYNERFDFYAKFKKIFDMSLDDYLKYTFMIHTHASGPGFFNKQTLFKFFNDIDPNFDKSKVLSILGQISTDRSGLEEKRRSFRALQREFSHHVIPLLKLYPILHVYNGWQEKAENNDWMIAPLPYLIVQRIHDLIYYDLFEQHKMPTGNIFCEWFGKLLELYCETVFAKIFSKTMLINEGEIKKTYSGGEIPDFVLIDGDTALLIECKAARLYRGLVESDDEKEFKKAFAHPKKAYSQLCNFADAINRKMPGLEKFHHVAKCHGVIVTWEEYSPMITNEIKKFIIKNDKNVENIPFIILSLDKLELLQASLGHTEDSVCEFIKLINCETSMRDLTGSVRSKDSFLEYYFSEWAKKIFPNVTE